MFGVFFYHRSILLTWVLVFKNSGPTEPNEAARVNIGMESVTLTSSQD